MDFANKLEEQKFFILLYIYHYRLLKKKNVDKQVLKEKIPDLSFKDPKIISGDCLDSILKELLEKEYIELKESAVKDSYFLSDSGRQYLEENELLFPDPKDSILERYLPKEALIKLLSALAVDLNAQISIMDKSGQFRAANDPPIGLCESCIRHESMPNVSCVCCDILAARRAKEYGAHSYRCHGGCIECIAPIKSNGNICGFVFLGRIVPDDLDAYSFIQYCESLRGVKLNLGNINKQIKEKGATKCQIQVMEKITNGIALLLSAMVKDLNDYATQLDTLRDVIESGVAVLSLDEILKRIMESAKNVLDYDGAAIWKFDPEKKKLFPIAWSNGLPEFEDKPEFDVEDEVGFVSWIARRKEPLLISNVPDHKKGKMSPLAKYPEYIEKKELGSFLGVPIFVENATFGVFEIERHGTGQYTELHQKLLSAVAQIAGIVIKNFMLLDVLTDISKIDSLDELLDAASRKMPLLVGAEYCSIFLFDSEKEKIILKATSSMFLSDEVNRAYYSNDRPGLTWRLAQTGETIMTDDDRNELGWKGQYLEAKVPGYYGYLGCALKDKSGDVSGVIRFIGKQKPSFGEFDKKLVEILSTWLSLAIDRMRLATIVGGHTELLLRISDIQKNSTDIDNFLDAVSREVALALRCNECVVAISDRKGGYEIKGVYGNRHKGKRHFAGDGSPIGRAIAEKNMIRDIMQVSPSQEKIARLCIPLMYGKEMTGVLLLKKVIPDPTTGFKSDDERTGNIVALEVARTIHEIQQRDNVSELLRKVDEQYMSNRNAQAAMEYMVRNLSTVIDDAFGTLYRYDTRDDIFVKLASSSIGGEPPKRTKTGHITNAFKRKEIQDIPAALESEEHQKILQSDEFDQKTKEYIRNIRSEYGIPLIVAGRVYGIFFFYKNQVYGFSISDKRAAQDLAAKASLLLEINALFDGMSRLYKASLALQSKLQLKDLLNSVVRGIISIGVDRARLYVLSEDGQRIESIAQIGLEKEENIRKFENREVFGYLYKSSDGVDVNCLNVEMPVLYKHKDSELNKSLSEKGFGDIEVRFFSGKISHEYELEKEGLDEWLDFPLIAADQKLGKITIDNKQSKRPFTKVDFEILGLLTQFTAQAILNALEIERTAGFGYGARFLAHNIKNKVGAIKLNLGLVERKLKESGLPTDDIEDIIRKTIRANQGIERHMNAMRKVAELEDTALKEINIVNLVNSILDELEEYQREDIAKPEVNISDGVSSKMVAVDLDQIIEVFLNLLANSQEAEATNFILGVYLSEEKSYVYFSWEDNGVGILEQDSERLFRLAHSKKAGGTGTGLFSVKQMLLKNKGDIWLDKTRRNKNGSYIARFIIKLPLLNNISS